MAQAVDPRGSDRRFQVATPSRPASDLTDLWSPIGAQVSNRRDQPSEGVTSHPMEGDLSILAVRDDAPPRTHHHPSIVASSPLPSSVRAMLERREISRRYDEVIFDLSPIEHRLPGLETAEDAVPFLASDQSFEDLRLSMDCLLQHRKRLLGASTGEAAPRRRALVLGAGPGGLITAVQLRLRDHQVVVCEQRESYTRNRFIGVYRDVAYLMAALGMPERMTYDFTRYRGKRGIMLADIQTFLHAVALKLGVVIYTGAVVSDLSERSVEAGKVDLSRSGQSSDGSSVGMTRWMYDSICHVRSGVSIQFDTIVEATGGRSGLRELLVGSHNVVSMRELGREAVARDPSLRSFFENPEDHCVEFVESDYGCPPELLPSFAAALAGDGVGVIPDELPCFVSNIDASVLTRPISSPSGIAALDGHDLDIPPDWVVVNCPLSDRTLERYQIEGPLPVTFEFGGERVPTRAFLDSVNPVSLLLRILYAMGVPFETIDRRRLIDFYTVESSTGDVSDVVATWVGRFSSLRMGGEDALWCGTVPGELGVLYAIVGEAIQNAWYRFGVGVDDTFTSAAVFAEGLDLPEDERAARALRLDRIMFARCVQVLYHLYSVAQHQDQGVVGPVLGDYRMEEQRGIDLVESRLRAVVNRGVEIRVAERDLHAMGSAADPLVLAGLGHLRTESAGEALRLLESFPYERSMLRRAGHLVQSTDPGTRAESLDALELTLSPRHRELVSPLFRLDADPDPADSTVRGEERLRDIARGRDPWVSPWLRACALRTLDPEIPVERSLLEYAAADSDALVAETAGAVLANERSDHLTVERVEILSRVSIFAAVPHEVLAGVAALLTDVQVASGQVIYEQGQLGDCMYVIASGRVRVHDGSRTLRILERCQYFGELSLIDVEPRSASVSALETTILFRLAQDDFHALLAERPEISMGLNRGLCHMIRNPSASPRRRDSVEG